VSRDEIISSGRSGRADRRFPQAELDERFVDEIPEHPYEVASPIFDCKRR